MVRYPSIPQDRRTMNGKSGTYAYCKAFALMYRRVNATFYEAVKLDGTVKKRQMQSPKRSRAYGAAYSAEADSATKAGRAREANHQEMVFAVCLAP